jgi:3-oxoacyl-(acyl-carrier-protein) synthase
LIEGAVSHLGWKILEEMLIVALVCGLFLYHARSALVAESRSSRAMRACGRRSATSASSRSLTRARSAVRSATRRSSIALARSRRARRRTRTVSVPSASRTASPPAAVASRAYDVNRDGFVIAGGAGILVLEDLERAKARGAKIYGEIVGYAANSDGFDMVAPSGEGAVRCMRLALSRAGNRKVDYLNPHGTSTPVGDIKEMEAVREVFGEAAPAISSTKSLTGHSLGAAGVQEAIYSLLMMQNNFAAASAHIEQLDPAAEGLPILLERYDGPLNTVMSNSFGFGGTNATLVFSKFKG